MNSTTTVPNRVPAVITQTRSDGREALRYVENLADIRLTKFSDREVVEFIFSLDRRQGMVPDYLRKALYGLIVIIRFIDGRQWALESETHAFRFDALLGQYILSVCAQPENFYQDFNLIIYPGDMILSVSGYSMRRCHLMRHLNLHEVEVPRVDPDAWVDEIDLAAAK